MNKASVQSIETKIVTDLEVKLKGRNYNVRQHFIIMHCTHYLCSHWLTAVQMNSLHRYKGFICSVVQGAVKTFHEFSGFVFAYPENNSL